MKRENKKIIVIVAICACLLAVGIIGISGNSNAVKSQQMTANVQKTAADCSNLDGLDLLACRTSNDNGSVIKDYEGFRLAFNPDNHTPDWVAWELLGSETNGVESRRSKFIADETVAGSPTSKDYTHSGYDRGHICPAADQKWSAKAMDDCFYMTNICPQDHALNSGAWSTLEAKERIWAVRDSAIIIVAGPVYNSSDKRRIGETGVRVPSAFYKVILAPFLEHPRAIGFVYPNMTSPGNMKDYVMTVDEVEKLTGIDFFYNLPDEIENIVESETSFTQWNRN